MKYLIAGLGNPGKEYEHTRHNVGFIIIETLLGEDTWEAQGKGAWEEAALEGDKKTILIKPLTFMNKSGAPLAAAAKRHGVRPENILVIHDELDMELGTVKMTWNKSAGTHKGVESVIKSLKTKKFWRVRVGIAPSKKPPTGDTKDFLLKKMTAAQEKKILENKKKIKEGILLWTQNKEKGMQRINTP